MLPAKGRQTVAETGPSEVLVRHSDCRFDIDRSVGRPHRLEGHSLDGLGGPLHLLAAAHCDRLVRAARRERPAVPDHRHRNTFCVLVADVGTSP
jgi:hypothetical protein